MKKITIFKGEEKWTAGTSTCGSEKILQNAKKKKQQKSSEGEGGGFTGGKGKTGQIN